MRWAILGMVLLFPLSEILLLFYKRSRRGLARKQDRRVLPLLWLVILLSVVLAFLFAGLNAGRLPLNRWLYITLVCGLMAVGMAVRWTAILTLGRYFTVDVAIHNDHVLVDRGLYRILRHPSYTGLLLEFTALGFYFANGLSLAVLLVPITTMLLVRIRVEEKALLERFGDVYAEYRARTRRLVPGVW